VVADRRQVPPAPDPRPRWRRRDRRRAVIPAETLIVEIPYVRMEQAARRLDDAITAMQEVRDDVQQELDKRRGSS
jgi:hypothetical protein